MSTRHPSSRDRGLALREFQVVGAVLLIALGGIFLAQQAGILSYSANWWVIFLFVPGLGLLWNGFTSHERPQPWTTMQVVEVVLGALLLALTVIFIFDPNWTFINWNRLFPNVNWDQVWPFFLVVPGVVMVLAGIVRGSVGVAVIGAIITGVGAVFVFDIDWNYVWPLALILPGFWWLYSSLRRNVQ